MVVAGAIGNMIDRIFYGSLPGQNGAVLFGGAVVDKIIIPFLAHTEKGYRTSPVGHNF